MQQPGSSSRPPKLALVLSGGGARAAYQVGVLSAVAESLPDPGTNPFAIVCGTSAGAINAAAVAAGARDLRRSTRRLAEVWSRLSVGDIYRAGAPDLARTCWRWIRAVFPGANGARPVALLDNSPLAELLAREIPFGVIPQNVAAGALEALAITASSYASGMSVSFCSGGPDLPLWTRSQRVGVRAEIGVSHVIASSAIPFLFPPARIGEEYFGDGAMRQIAPTAPALHLGADRILVVGAAANGTAPPANGPHAPSLAQIGSHVLSSVFTDALGTDVEKVRLVNVAVRQIPPEHLARSPMPLRDVMILVITPSVPLETLAAAHVERIPRSLRLLLGAAGSGGSGGAGLLSYLLFDGGFCSAAAALGHQDAKARAPELAALLSRD